MLVYQRLHCFKPASIPPWSVACLQSPKPTLGQIPSVVEIGVSMNWLIVVDDIPLKPLQTCIEPYRTICMYDMEIVYWEEYEQHERSFNPRIRDPAVNQLTQGLPSGDLRKKYMENPPFLQNILLGPSTEALARRPNFGGWHWHPVEEFFKCPEGDPTTKPQNMGNSRDLTM